MENLLYISEIRSLLGYYDILFKDENNFEELGDYKLMFDEDEDEDMFMFQVIDWKGEVYFTIRRKRDYLYRVEDNKGVVISGVFNLQKEVK